MAADPLKALFTPFETGQIPLPGTDERVLFVNGEACAGLAAFPKAESILIQTYNAARPTGQYDHCAEIPDEDLYDLILLSGAQQQQELRHAMAAALLRLKTGGLFVATAANDAGGRRLRDEAEALGLMCEESSRSKCRIISARRPAAINDTLCSSHMKAGGFQAILDGRFISRPGIFSWDRIDAGSAFLAQTLPHGSLTGAGADFGCGWGYLSCHMLEHHPGIQTLHAIDADSRALTACERNTKGRVSAQWADITKHPLPENLDFILMNPPFHAGKATLPTIGRSFIKRARQSLRKGGVLWMVANAHLPYEDIMTTEFSSSAAVATGQGYKIFKAVA